MLSSTLYKKNKEEKLMMSAMSYGQKQLEVGSIHEDCSGFDYQPLSKDEQKKVQEQNSNSETNNSDNK
jgi:hypothetical protein